ncbi:hypothetical protein CLAFUW4_03783 [Fulvia fulva]|uniref:Uncharacterized protein n=1 Tax=Passalora fulva TaxID=5499 RepID=A0A9Q8P5Z0_PASFU|nr:uncharacterized protein CLAFUR5_03755 [Fulvia fulva]KAK4631164.1 hypothetical protein CLAFUR4_03771 [Fulvia fulva]UJO14267.1 hypothetical protein CLAFUR5_03755 [Fulvia fulva]WPV10626.1 hypothetical protein CLAFUW4_03783 [Fulvia fulva]WPV26456.1 hypothetical protein CLAFUW7_03775 [Fulvia fulva]
MAIMTSDTDLERRFYQDYKQCSFGFAVVKARGVYDDFSPMAMKNNMRRQLPTTIVKQVLYGDDFRQVKQEVVKLFFNEFFHNKDFKRAVRHVILEACRSFHGDGKVVHNVDSIEVTRGGTQTPRLLLLPLVQRIVEEHLRFVYSHAIDRFVACGFFSGENADRDYGHPGSVLPVESNLSFQEVKSTMTSTTETSFLTLPEYWKVYREFEKRPEVLKSLTDSRYVELLDTQIMNGQSEIATIINLDTITHIKIQPAAPALVHPKDIGEGGFPERLSDPAQYSDAALWRYWSPDSAHNVATRGHIFVMNRPCIDLKISPDEKTKCLTFRPMYRTIPDLKCEVERVGERWVEVKVYPRLFNVRR